MEEPEIIQAVGTFPPLQAGSMLVLRIRSADPQIAHQLLEALKRHYGHDDFLVVILGLHESIDVIPAAEVAAWIQNRHGYFGGVGGRYLEEKP